MIFHYHGWNLEWWDKSFQYIFYKSWDLFQYKKQVYELTVYELTITILLTVLLYSDT